jgi:hypothetical protein
VVVWLGGEVLSLFRRVLVKRRGVIALCAIDDFARSSSGVLADVPGCLAVWVLVSANFLEPEAARAALAARIEADFRLTSTGSARIDRLIDRARRLRELYGIRAAGQRAPFFEIQTSDFALIAIDTGIRRTLDERQRAWLSGALERARGKFIMVIPGHPRYAAGLDASVGDAAFSELYATLERAGVDVVMAGDTHTFEYYVDHVDERNGVRPVYHFVNGGGGAYLSIGGALGWPDSLPTGLLSGSGSRPRQAGCRNPLVEMADLGVDPALRYLAGLDRDPVGDVRLQPRPVLSELRRGPRRAFETPRGVRAARGERRRPLARPAHIVQGRDRRKAGRPRRVRGEHASLNGDPNDTQRERASLNLRQYAFLSRMRPGGSVEQDGSPAIWISAFHQVRARGTAEQAVERRHATDGSDNAPATDAAAQPRHSLLNARAETSACPASSPAGPAVASHDRATSCDPKHLLPGSGRRVA